MAVTVPEMLKMSQAQLDDLFTQSPVGEIPSGQAKGTAIVAPGTTYTQDIANFINHFAWQEKIFDLTKGILRNKILPFGLNAIIARLYKGPSWSDNKSASFSISRRRRCWHIGSATKFATSRHTFISAKFSWGKKRLIDFALEFPAPA
jgi:hypothetical protein